MSSLTNNRSITNGGTLQANATNNANANSNTANASSSANSALASASLPEKQQQQESSTLSSSSMSVIPIIVESKSSQQRVVISEAPRPFKMNTYIQLEIDQSNFNTLPRVCKFLVTKLQIEAAAPEMSMNSVIMAVKLQVSKRSLRTLEIPLHQEMTGNASWAHVDLNLNYNITYPHHLKKDTNLLYFYIQRRKKYKTKKIMGYKTLAFAVVDLATVVQRPFSNEIALYQPKSGTSGRSSQQRNGMHHNGCGGKQVIGYLTVQSLVSIPTDLNDENIIVLPQHHQQQPPQQQPSIMTGLASAMQSSQLMANSNNYR